MKQNNSAEVYPDLWLAIALIPNLLKERQIVDPNTRLPIPYVVEDPERELDYVRGRDDRVYLHCSVCVKQGIQGIERRLLDSLLGFVVEVPDRLQL